MSKWQWRAPWPRRAYLWFRYTWPICTICDLFIRVRYMWTGDCGYVGCGYVEPYGFVPEAGCPVHDNDSCLSRWARKVRNGRD